MPAYIIAEVDVHDPVPYEEYRKLIGPTLAKYGGKFIVRGGMCVHLEGGWRPSRMVVIEFPDMQAAEHFYYSAEYKPVLDMRLRAGKSKAIIVDGHSG